MEEVIVELRGQGVILKLFHLSNELMTILNEKATEFGEPLDQAWFDPFFWHLKEMSELRKQIKPSSEYRGLMDNSRSFIEIRRKGKRRKKYTVAELAGDNQLFPMIGLSIPNWKSEFNRNMVLEYETVTGCPAQFVYSGIENFNLSNWNFIQCSESFGDVLLTSTHDSNLKLIKDDYLVRGQYLTTK